VTSPLNPYIPRSEFILNPDGSSDAELYIFTLTAADPTHLADALYERVDACIRMSELSTVLLDVSAGPPPFLASVLDRFAHGGFPIAIYPAPKTGTALSTSLALAVFLPPNKSKAVERWVERRIETIATQRLSSFDQSKAITMQGMLKKFDAVPGTDK